MIREVEQVRTRKEDCRNMGFFCARVQINPKSSDWGRVQINPNSPLITGFYLTLAFRRLIWVSCTYENVAKFCRRCGLIGHPSDRCRKTNNSNLEIFLNNEVYQISQDHKLPCWTDFHIDMFTSKIRAPNPKSGSRVTSFSPTYLARNKLFFTQEMPIGFQIVFNILEHLAATKQTFIFYYTSISTSPPSIALLLTNKRNTSTEPPHST